VVNLRLLTAAVVCLSPPLVIADWEADPSDEAQVRGAETLEQFRESEDEVFQALFDESYAFVVFPAIKRYSLIAGWASGKGIVVENGRFIGYSRQRRFSLGFQLGYQTQGQTILFRDRETLEDWKRGTAKFTPQASANSSGSGGAADTGFNPRVAVFSLTRSGLAVEASAGTTRYKFTPAPSRD
jgi:lipid-binding SYLF domain-containing protein